MKLEIYTEKGWMPIINRQNYFTEYEYDGTQTLSFDIHQEDDIYEYIKNEVLVRNNENLYIIKTINKRKMITTITCILYMDEWYTSRPYIETKELAQFQTKTISQILEYIKPSGWTITNAGIRSIQRTIELQNASNYDVLMNCQNIYDVVYAMDVNDKTIVVIDPAIQVDTGLYITPQLNMKSFEFTGNSKDYATRISAYGKQNEDGSYVNFAAINNGKDYVESTSYSNKIKWIVWRDERYTVPESLLADAKRKLEKQAFPVLSYTVGVNDLAQYDERYAFMNFQLYYLAHTVIDENTSIMQTIVKMKKYHDTSDKNEITLSTEAEKITSKVDKAISVIGDDGQKITGSILQQAQEQATALINQWAEKGYVYQTENEIYILDKLPKETAKYCIRMNLGGIAFSQNGWKGPYISAWTIDGRFNADFITAGVLRGIQITNGNNFSVDASGNMTAKNGSFTGKVNASSGNIGSLMITENGLTFKGKVGYPEYTTSGIITKYGTWTIELNPDKFGMFGSDKVCMTANFKSDDGAINAGFDLSALALKINHVSANSMESYSYTNLSEKRFKKLIKEPEKGLDVVLGTDVKTFRYKGENDDNRRHCGFVIGDGYNIHKSLVAQIDVKGETVEGVDLYTSIGYAYKAIQELKEEIDILKKEVHK